MSVAPTPRPHCLRCHKPQLTCVCASIQPVDNRTRVLVLQHPRERLHPIGTARFASLGLRNARVEVAWNASLEEDAPPAWLPDGAALLYPGPAARDLRDLPVAERPSQLLVLDGTWHTARTLYRDKHWLHALPQLRFLPARPGRYRLRREPRHDYVSTIEAIVEALHILEPDTDGLEGLLLAFDAMIDRQLSLRGTDGGRVRKRRRPEAERRMPRALVDDWERLVIVYGESSRPRDAAQREMIQLCALAPASGRMFEGFAQPSAGVPAEDHLTHMRLPAETFSAADSGDALRAGWREFLAGCAAPVRIAAWNHGTLDMLARNTGEVQSPVSLKSAYRAIYGRTAQGLTEAIAERGLTPQADRFQGRAAGRLACAVEIARHLHARAIAKHP